LPMFKDKNHMQEIIALIEDNQIKEALQALKLKLPQKSIEVSALISRLSELESKLNNLGISQEGHKLELHEIRKAALALCQATENTPLAQKKETLDPGQAPASAPSTKKVFFSYSKADAELLKQFKVHLSSLRRQGKIAPWDDSRILAGEEWDDAIKKELQEADIILLLISADFLATDYIWNVEIETAMQRHERGEARVIPVFLRPCDWSGLTFSKLNGLPSKAIPVVDHENRDQAWLSVVEGIKRVL
jgi:TIR domain